MSNSYPNVESEIRKIVELELLSLENPGLSKSTFRFIGKSFLVTDKKTSYVFSKNLREIFLRFSIAGCFNISFFHFYSHPKIPLKGEEKLIPKLPFSSAT